MTARNIAGLLFVCLVLFLVLPGAAKEPKPGFNLFKTDQDIEAGQKVAAEVEHTTTILDIPELNVLMEDIGKKVSAMASKTVFPFKFRVIKDKTVNAYAAPGGPIYITSGTIQAVRNESELAGMIAHEVGHVILRHGTSEATREAMKTSSFKAGGVSVMKKPQVEPIIAAEGSLGLNSVFFKYDKSAEEDADVVGVHQMAKTGYNPNDLAAFFEVLIAGQKSGKPIPFLSSHPNPDNRVTKIKDEIRSLKSIPKEAAKDNSRLERAQSILKLYDN